MIIISFIGIFTLIVLLALWVNMLDDRIIQLEEYISEQESKQ